MSVIVIPAAEVDRVLPMHETIEAMDRVLRSLARGEAVLPLRSLVKLPGGDGLLGLMPAVLGEPAIMGLKVVSVMPGNHGTELDAHQGAVMIFETGRGQPLAIIDATSVTRIRTGAVSGVATRALAREDAGDLAILGSGTQAISHLEAMSVVRKLRRVRVWSNSTENARRFAEREGARLKLEVEVTASAEQAVRGADLICTTTSAREPILQGDWISEGAHINAVGACFPTTRELDTAAMRRARLFVDRRESALNEAGEFLIPRAEGAITDAHILGELGEVLLGKVPGRKSADDVTLFKSLGIAIEDLAAAHWAWQRARAEGIGIEIELGGMR
ncbi:MAG: ornithine cyclodeaminase family protein [Candidatus Eiseniibacteriota bacterium]